MKLPIDQIEAGMKLAGDVVNLSGALLLGAGTTLNLRHVGILRAWGVDAVHVERDDSSEPGGGRMEPEWTGEEWAQAEEEIGRRFRHVRCELEPVVKVRELASQRLATRRASQRLKGGEVLA